MEMTKADKMIIDAHYKLLHKADIKKKRWA